MVGIVHRDIKPENILVDLSSGKPMAKLNDFGLSSRFSPMRGFLNSFCGSPLYASPEMVLKEKYLGPEPDVFSLGVVLHALLTGNYPWRGNTMSHQMNNALTGTWLPASPFLSTSAVSLLDRMLQGDRVRRATIEEVRTHPWLQGAVKDSKYGDVQANAPPSSSYGEQRAQYTDIEPYTLSFFHIFGLNAEEAVADVFAHRVHTWAYFICDTLRREELAAEICSAPPPSPCVSPRLSKPTTVAAVRLPPLTIPSASSFPELSPLIFQCSPSLRKPKPHAVARSDTTVYQKRELGLLTPFELRKIRPAVSLPALSPIVFT